MTPRGGKRPGTGPKPKPVEEKASQLTIKLIPSEKMLIREGASRLNLSQSRLIVEAVRAYLADREA